MTTTILERRGLARLAVLSLPAAAVLLLPTGAIGATSGAGGSTVRATIGGDGAVKSVRVYAPDGSTSSFNGEMPLKVSISRTVSGSTSTYTYHVENTVSKTQQITYNDTAGKSHTSTVDVQLPLVAQLGVQLPKSFDNVSAPNGVVQTDPNGLNRVLYTMILFSPLGSPTQDATFTATGSGAPTAELSATTVNPSTTAGISQSAQDANANSQQDDFWASFASGGNGGLTQLATGVGQMVTGLVALAPGAHKLADGLKAAGDGANKLDAGTAKAFAGSKKLAAGANAAHAGSKKLATGLGQIHAGNSSLATGLGQISGGLGQLADPTNGLPAAVAGIDAIDAGVKAIIAGVGSASTNNTLLFGTNAIEQGATALINGFTDPAAGIVAGLTCSEDLINATLTGRPANTQDPCFTAFRIPTAPGVTPVSDQIVQGALTAAKGILDNVLTGLNTQVVPGLTQIRDGAHLLTLGLSHPTHAGGPSDPGGVLQGLQAIDAGLAKLKTGASAAVAGVNALNTGAAAAHTGAQQLAAGSGSALTGSQALASGLGQISSGASALSTGLGQLSAGQHQVATGLPAAVSGSQQIADGADQLLAGAKAVHTGILAVQSGAVAPLLKQISEGSLNAKKQLAILDASNQLSSSAPGGADAVYVLSQSPNGFKLAASTTSDNGSHTTRNVGIGLGGLALLVIAVTAGFMIGRRATVSA